MRNGANVATNASTNASEAAVRQMRLLGLR
jgi:hypothetical protein